MRPYSLFSLCVALLLVFAPAKLAAQQGASDVEQRGRIHGVRPPPGFYETLASDPDAYQFQRVWKSVARQVSERRHALARRGDYAALNRHMGAGTPSRAAAQASGTAVTGTFTFPVLIGYFQDSTHVHQPDSATLSATMFSTAAAPPYSITTYYDEASDNLLTVTGDVIDWHKVDSTSTWYEGSGNGLSPATDHTGDFIKELLDAADATIDFSAYDGDGDTFVDLVAILHPLKDGACGSSHIWAHRWVYSAWKGSAYATNDGVSINDYVIQAAVGGSSGCDSTLTMAIGTMTHELGHGILDLPDLYDIYGASEGIGWWGLMGSGNWNTQTSPAHLSAWSKDEVGWITLDTVSMAAGSGAHTLRPVVTSDTALRINLSGTTEYFLLENRHAIGSDVNVAGEGLAIWHVAPDLIAARRPFNEVNSIDPHGIDLEQADGLDHLGNDVNRGDSGDPYPGSTGNTAFGPSTTPNSELTDNSASGLVVDSITINGDMSIAFRVMFNQVDELVTTSLGAGTEVIVDGSYEDAPYSVTKAYPGMMEISVDSIQGDTLIRHVFQSWSDAGARTHNVALDATPDTFTADLQTQHRVRATAEITGMVSSSLPLDVNGIRWMVPSDSIQVVGIATAGGYQFAQWTGDTTYNADTLVLHMSRPWTVRARFGTAITVTTDTLLDGLVGGTYADTLDATGGTGSHTWTHAGGDPLPDGLVLDAATGAIGGYPEEEGDFAMVFEAASGAITQTDTVYLSVSAPSLQTTDVVNHLIGPVSVLSEDEERFLDIIGNNNGGYDVGDLRAYLQSVGLAVDLIPADLLESAARKEGGR